MRWQTGAYVLLLLWSFMSFLCFLSWSFPRVAWVSGIHWFSWFTSFKISLFMFFTTFDIKAEINRIIFVFSLSLPKEKSKFRFWEFRATTSTTPRTVASTPLEWCRGSTGNGRHLAQAQEGCRMVHRSRFMRILQSPNQFSQIMMKTFCICYTHTYTHLTLLFPSVAQ